MNLVRWHAPDVAAWPFSRLSNLRDEIDRLFEAPLSELSLASQVFGGWTPALDVHENDDQFTVTAELPGMRKEDIEISLHDGTLSISGERKSSEEHKDSEVYRSERFVGRFQRTVALPSSVAADKVKAQCQDGVLTVTLPKAEEAKPKRIDVNVN